jgi:hypothetical protein
MVLHETTAKPMEIRKRRRKVIRQRSRWRFSNRSRREEIVGRFAPPAGASFAEFERDSSCLGIENADGA